MPRSHCNNTNGISNQDNMSCPEISTPIVIFPEKDNLADTQDNDFKIAIIKMLKELKENKNKCLNGDRKTQTAE